MSGLVVGGGLVMIVLRFHFYSTISVPGFLVSAGSFDSVYISVRDSAARIHGRIAECG